MTQVAFHLVSDNDRDMGHAKETTTTYTSIKNQEGKLQITSQLPGVFRMGDWGFSVYLRIFQRKQKKTAVHTLHTAHKHHVSTLYL